jgi:hypothetical protein
MALTRMAKTMVPPEVHAQDAEYTTVPTLLATFLASACANFRRYSRNPEPHSCRLCALGTAYYRAVVEMILIILMMF